MRPSPENFPSTLPASTLSLLLSINSYDISLVDPFEKFRSSSLINTQFQTYIKLQIFLSQRDTFHGLRVEVQNVFEKGPERASNCNWKWVWYKEPNVWETLQ